MFDIKSGVRNRQEAEVLETVSIADMIATVGAKDINLVSDKLGTQFMHLVNGDQYLTIKVGKKVTLTTTGTASVKELINNYLIYAGVNEGRTWFTFGPKPENNRPTVTVSVASLFAQEVKAN